MFNPLFARFAATFTATFPQERVHMLLGSENLATAVERSRVVFVVDKTAKISRGGYVGVGSPSSAVNRPTNFVIDFIVKLYVSAKDSVLFDTESEPGLLSKVVHVFLEVTPNAVQQEAHSVELVIGSQELRGIICVPVSFCVATHVTDLTAWLAANGVVIAPIENIEDIGELNASGTD